MTADSPEALVDRCMALMKDSGRLASMAEILSRIAEKPSAEIIFYAMYDEKQMINGVE